MAKKKDELKLDEFTLDPELDFDFSQDVDGSLSQEAKSKKSRSPILDVFKGAGQGVADTLTSPSFFKPILRRTLPREYGEIENAGSDITTGVRELYDQTVRELNPRVNAISAKLDRLVPDSQKKLKGLLKKINEATDDGKGKTSSYSTESQEEQSVSMAMADVFKAQAQQSKITDAKEMMHDKINLDRHNQSTNVLGEIAHSASTISQYTVNVTQAFQKKSLELQLRSYFGQKEYYGKSLTVLQELKAQQDAIVRNTALPEYAKITETERFKERAKNRFIDGLYGEGSFFKKGFDRLKKSAGEFTQGLGQRLDTVSFGLDQAEQTKEQIAQMNEMAESMGMEPMSRAKMMGMGLAGAGMGLVQDYAVDKGKALVDGHNGIKETVAKVAKGAVNPGGYLSDFRTSAEWQERLGADNVKGKAARGLDFILSHFTDEGSVPNRAVATGNSIDDLDHPAEGFSKKASLSLTAVIPGYLAYIHRELARIRTKQNNAPLMTYDYARGEFTTTSTMQTRIVEMFKDKVDQSRMGSSLKTAENNFIGDREVDEDDRLAIRIFLARLARENDVRLDDFNAIKNTRAFDSLSDLTKNQVESYFTSMTNSNTSQQQTYQFTKSVKDIRESMPSLNKELGEMVSAGYGEHLEKEKLVKKSKDGTRYNVNEEAYYKFLEDREIERDTKRRADIAASDPSFNGPYAIGAGGYYPSDVNVKTDIRETDPESSLQKLDKKFANSKINPKNAFEGFKKTKLYSYFYDKNKVDDDQQHDGPMAQDVKKNLGEEAAPKGKKIDVQSITSSFFSAVKYLGDKYDALVEKTSASAEANAEKQESPIRGRNYLKEIADHTKKTNQLLLSRPMSGIGVKRAGKLTGKQTDDSLSVENEGGYIGMVSKLISKGFTDIRDKIVKPTYQNSRDHVVKPLYGAAKDVYDNNKDDAKKKLGEGYDYVKEIGKKAANRIADFATIDVPDGLGWLKGKANQGWQNLKKQFDDLKDLYLPDGKEPVIRAFKIKLGFYLDEQTGEPLTSMKQILECKNNIVDKAGNILLSVEDRADGLYDRYGDQVKGYLGKLLTGAIGVGSYMFGKAGDLLKGLKDGSLKGIDSIKGFFKDKSFFKDGFPGLDFGGIGGKEAKDELVNIRDILLGDADGVRERIKKKGEKLSKKAMAGDGDTSSTPETEGAEGESKDKPGQPASVADTVAKYTQGTAVGNLFNKLRENLPGVKDKLTQAKDVITTKAKDNIDKLKETAATLESKGKHASEKETVSAGINWSAPKGQMSPYATSHPKDAKAIKTSSTGTSTESAFVGPMPELVGPVQPTSRKGIMGKATAIKDKLAAGRVGKVLGAGKRLGGGLLGGAMSLLGGAQAAATPGGGLTDTPETAQARDAELKEGEEDYDKVKQITSAKKGRVAKKDRDWNDADGSGSRDGGVEDREDKAEALRQSRQKKGAQADLTLRYKSSENVIDKMMGMASGFLGLLTGKLGSLFDMTKTVLGKIPGLGAIGTAVGGFLKSPLSKLGGLASGGVGLAVKGAAGLALKGGLAFGGLMLNAGMAVGGAALSVLTSPIVLTTAAVGAAAYGAYKLYKYTTRNNANVYDRLRLRQYGFGYNDVVDRFNHYPLALESYLEDGRVGYTPGTKQAYLLDKKIDNKDLFEMMAIDPNKTEQVEKFKTWFRNRFQPVFLAHQTALLSQDNKAKLSAVQSLKPIDRLKYLEVAKVKDSSIYSVDVSPIEGLELDVNDTEILQYHTNLIEKDRLAAEADAKKSPIPPKPEALAKASGVAKTTEASGDATSKEMIDKAEALRQQNQRNNEKLQATEGGSDSEPNPTSFGRKLPTEGKNFIGKNANIGKLPLAPGELKDGSDGRRYLSMDESVDLNGISPAMYKNFMGMAQEYGELTGRQIGVNSAKRSFEQQKALHTRNPKKAAAPGKSLHEYGLAIDINTIDANELEKMGLMKKYGFTRPIGQELWHIEPAGIQQNLDEAKKRPQVAEALVAASLKRGGGGYGTMPDAKRYGRNTEVAIKLFNSSGEVVTDKAIAAANDASAQVSKGVASQEAPAGTVKEEVTKQTSGKVVDIATARDKTKDVNDVKMPLANEPETKASETNSGKAPAGISANGGSRGDVKDIIDRQAKKAGVDPELVKTFAAVESGLDPKAKAKGSSASGLMQFTDSTWREQLGKASKKYGLDPNSSPMDPEAAALVGSEYIKSNMKILGSVKANPNSTDIYLAHFLGPSGAKKFLSADQSAPAADSMPDAAKSNRNIFFDKSGKPLSFGDIYKGTENKLKTKASAFGISLATSSGEGLKQKSPENQGTGLKVSENTLSLPAANDAMASAPKATETSTQGKSRVPGFSFDDRTATQRTTGKTEVGTSMAGGNMTGIEGILSQSLSIHEKSLSKLETIASSLTSEELVKAFATALQAMPKPEGSTKEETVKAKDQVNMGRTSEMKPSAIDLRRRSA